MFGILKKKLREVFRKTEKELQQETKEEEKEVKEEIKEIESEEKEIKKQEVKVEEKKQVEKLEQDIVKLKKEKKGLFSKLKKAITTTKISEEGFEKFFSELEIVLIENNVALEAIDYLKAELKKDILGIEIKKGRVGEEIKKSLEKAISSMLIEPFDWIGKIKEKTSREKPYTIVFFGINGVGKTLSIAKVAHLLKQNNLSCVLAASDTFRAAAIEQLSMHAQKLGVEMIKHKYGSDPSAVAYDARAHAKAKGIDVVLIDTAGRIHTKLDLIKEMEKIIRVAKPDLKIFIGESIAGNDVIEQVKAFNEAVGIDAMILTKADVDEKGGTAISVSYVTKKPILFLGTGQRFTDLKKFNKKELLESIFKS